MVVTIGQETKKTEVMKKTLNPTWNQVLSFPIASDVALDEVFLLLYITLFPCFLISLVDLMRCVGLEQQW